MKSPEFYSGEKLLPGKQKKSDNATDLSPFREGVIGRKSSEGSFADIHEINKPREDFPDRIIKIGKTEDYTPPLLKDKLRIKFSRKKISDILVKLLGPKFQIHPDQDFIENGVAEYLLMKEYFGSDEKEAKNTSQNNREELLFSLQDHSSSFYKEMTRVLGNDTLVAEVVQTLKNHQKDNFFPKEQTIIGHPPNLTRERAEELQTQGEKLPVTYYIYQEKIVGANVVPLCELNEEELLKHPQLIEKLLTFAVLTKKMYSDTRKLIDTRPEELAKHPFEWFQKTANILLDKDKQELSFVDTRWLWDGNSRIGKGGVDLIKHLGVKSVDNVIKKYAAMLNSLKGSQS
ncbi:MAG: hypothetical protein V1814_03450 [Candidatus Moraniibacteriota bacterium]